MKVLIIIPCYNEEKSIEAVVEAIKSITLTCNHPLSGFDYIIINDCSTDNTLDVCIKNDFNYLGLPVNLGIGGAVQAGYRYAYENGYDIAIQHDGDGQHDPAFFEDVIKPITSDSADIVIGSRFINFHGYQSTGLRRFGIALLSSIIRLCTGVKVYDVTSGYRAVNRKLIEFFANNYTQDYPEPESLVEALWNNARVLEVPVIMHERKEGKSSINALKSMHYMIKVSLSILLHRIQKRK